MLGGVDISDAGRYVIGSLALIVAGFALGSLSRVGVSSDGAIAILGGAATLLVLAGLYRRRDR
jgi:hypothetical protein